MRHRRAGFSLIELLIVCVMVGGLTMIALPRIKTLRDTYNVQSAKQHLASTVATARAAAVQKGRPAWFRVSGNRVAALVPIAANDTIFAVPPRDLGQEFGVTITIGRAASDSLITFDPRGFASPRLTGTARYIISAGSKVDTLCLGLIGQLMTRRCGL